MAARSRSGGLPIRGKPTLAVVFGMCLAIANVTAAKLAFFTFPLIGGVAVPAGFIAIGVAFLLSDLMAEFYGRSYAHYAVNATILGLVVSWALIYAAILLPSAPFFEAEAAFRRILGSGTNIVLASIVTTLISQNVDVAVFHRIRAATGAGHRWARNVGSTAVSQLIDTTLFILLGFVVFPSVLGGTPQALGVAGSLIVGQYVVKLIVAGLDTPVFYLVTSLRSAGTESVIQ